jgi:hypothetical protein
MSVVLLGIYADSARPELPPATESYIIHPPKSTSREEI